MNGTARRYASSAPCPICGGHAGLQRGYGARCAGFALDRVAYCTREEFAGGLPLDLDTSPPSYKHRLAGPCDCGTSHPRALEPRPEQGRHRAPTPPPIEVRHAIYSRALDILDLRPEGLSDLIRRGLPAELARVAGYRSLPPRGSSHQAFLEKLVGEFGEDALRACPGFTDKNDRLSF